MIDTPIVFDYIIPIRRKATARKRDPKVSHDAAARVELGKAEQQRQAILKMLYRFGGLTCKELAGVISNHTQVVADSVDIGKRIGEVEGIAPTGEVRNGSRVWSIV